MKKIRKIAVLFLVMLMCLPLNVSATGAMTPESQTSTITSRKESNGTIVTDEFEVKVVFGLEGAYRSNASIPVTMYMESLKEDFEGIVRIIVPENYDYGTESVAYEKDIMLSKASRKVITLSVTTSAQVATLRMQIEDKKGNVVLDKNIVLNNNVDDSALIGALSDDYMALNYFDNLALDMDSYAGTTSLLNLETETFPDQASSIEMLSYLIINSFDTSQLSKDQYQAIMSWVQQGGVVILGAGPDYQQTLSAFLDDLEGGNIQGNTEGTLKLADTISGPEQAEGQEENSADTSSQVKIPGAVAETVAAQETTGASETTKTSEAAETSETEGTGEAAGASETTKIGETAEISETAGTDRAGETTAESETVQTSETTSVSETSGSANASASSGGGVVFGKEQGILNLSLANGTPVSGVLTNDKLIWSQDYGRGKIVVTAFNLGMEPVESWKEKAQMAKGLLEAVSEGYIANRISDLNYGAYTNNFWSMTEVLDSLHEIKTPNMKLMLWLFVGFIVLLGPGFYLILKLFDKREWMWLLVPVLAVGFTAGIFILNKDLRLENPRTSSVTTLYYDTEESNEVSKRINLSVQVPDADKESVVFDPSLTNLKLYSNSYYYSYGETEKYDYKTAVRETAEGFRLNINNKSTFGSTYVGLNQVAQEEILGLDLELTKKTSGITGTITNNTGRDLQGVCIFTSAYSVLIGNMEAGESKTFTEKDNMLFSQDMYWNWDIPGIERFSRDHTRMEYLMEMMYSDYLYDIGTDDVYTFAFLPEWEADYVVSEEVKEVNSAVFIRHDSVGYEDYEDGQVLRLYDYSSNEEEDWSSDGYIYEQEAEVEFTLPVEEVYQMICAKPEDARYGSTEGVTVYAYNVNTETYEEIFKDGYTEFFENGCPYISSSEAGTIMKLKFTAKTPYESYSPEILVIGGGKNAGN